MRSRVVQEGEETGYNMTGMAEALQNKITETVWDNVLPRLHLYALRQISSLGLEGAVAPEDVVYDAILSVVERDVSHIEDVSRYLMLVIKHDISDIARKQRRKVALDEAEAQQAYSDENLNKTIEDAEFFDRLRTSVKDDVELTRVIEAIIEDSSLKSAELAEKLGISVHELYNLKKRLRKRFFTLKK
jgi:DNA-directed RNA polymerase specialized sigma24 family protein